MEKAEIESIPIKKTFELKDEKDAYDAAEEMVKIGFYKEKKGFKVLMPKEPKKMPNVLDISLPLLYLLV